MSDHARDLLLAFAIIGIVLPTLTLPYWFNRRRGLHLVQKWAAENNIQIRELRFQYLARGPFLLGVRDGDQIFRITGDRADGSTATGWLRCSTRMFGRYAGRVDVRWDEVRGFPVIFNDPELAATPSAKKSNP